MANILLIGKYSIVEPLGLMFLASAIKDSGHNPTVFLYKEDDGSDIIKNVFTNSNYDFIGFSTYTGIHKIVYRKADILSEFFPIIIGGSHTTAFYKESKSHATYVVLGEGLESIKNILNGKIKPGIVFTPYMVKPEYYPFPNREVVYNSCPELKNNPIKSVLTSLGCPFSCFYCFNSSYNKLYENRKVRQRPVYNIIEECLDLKKYPLELIYFQDDCFGTNIQWLKEFSEDYKKEVNVPFHCQMRPEMITDERLSLLKEAGCQGMTIAIETMNDDVRINLLGRKLSIEKMREAGKLIKKYKLRLRTEQMLGLPNTSIEDELEMLKFNIEIQPDIAWTSIFAPYLGTNLGDWCKSNNWYDGTNDDLSESFFSNTRLNFDKERVIKTNMLHHVFSTCAKLPNGVELARKFINKKDLSFDSWFKVMRQHLYDSCLYKEVE